MDQATIVVGIDGSLAAAEALRWAAWQSQLTGAPLVAVHAYTGDSGPASARADFHQAEEASVRAQATAWLRQALASADAVPYRTRLEIEEGPVREVLARHCAEAQLLVLGQPSRSPGRDAAQPADGRASDCPVVTVPSRGEDGTVQRHSGVAAVV
ncbi:universal stress protein [Nocardioides mesophilus]|uniref:Universal stress protein n=1 Tax=Nocardioides mesophilus TaxID=433659 RepID=A0A7G9R8F6_9ACTN|nr:universal stress protein [Nocardioides mesophilus]QNN51881.1 universal stress protein [Nocardioides mesophilus]